MTLVKIGGRFYDVPECWNELTAAQLLQVIRVICLKDYRAEEMILKLLQVITGMSDYRFLRQDLLELDEFLYLTAFLLREEMDFTHNLIPEYTFRDGDRQLTFYGPEDGFSNLRMEELALSEHLFLSWYEEKDNEQLLNELVATIYRPAPAGYDLQRNPDGDRREPCNQNISSFNARRYIARWPLVVRLAIAYWYNGCKQAMIRSNTEVFEGGTGEPAKYGMVSVMLGVAESGVFGPMDSVNRQYVNLVMMHLNEQVALAKKMKEESKA
ncbi:MAG: hypothetical protein EOP84_02070 [Verrucomicrobiaceae bacterium]|nr:MAG: hypothetical protein EOP84_02070 [Verrucomicrobiaceae bacterium]